MIKSFFIFVAAFILSVAAVNNILAQSTPSVPRPKPSDFLQSPTSLSTRGRITSNVDDYIHSAYYKRTGINNLFSFASFENTSNGTLGFAKAFARAYLAAYYGGNMFQNYTNGVYEEKFVGTAGSRKSLRAYSSGHDISDVEYNDNRFALLFGAGNIGLRLSYASTHDRFKETDLQLNLNNSTTTNYKSYEAAKGWIVPQVQLGVAKPILANGIQPSITFDLGLYKYYAKGEIYDGAWNTNGEMILYSENYVQPKLALSFGGFIIHAEENFEASIDLDASATMKMYRNDFTYQKGGAGPWLVETVKGCNSQGLTLTGLSENSYRAAEITPSIKLTYTGIDHRLGFAASLYIPIQLEESSNAGMNWTGTALMKHGKQSIITSASIGAVFSMGIQYKVFTNKLIVNAGGELATSRFSIETMESDVYAFGIRHGTPYKQETSGLDNSASSGIYLGFTFYFSQHVSVDAVTGVRNNDSINFWDVGSINSSGRGSGNALSFAKILFQVKLNTEY